MCVFNCCTFVSHHAIINAHDDPKLLIEASLKQKFNFNSAFSLVEPIYFFCLIEMNNDAEHAECCACKCDYFFYVARHLFALACENLSF